MFDFLYSNCCDSQVCLFSKQCITKYLFRSSILIDVVTTIIKICETPLAHLLWNFIDFPQTKKLCVGAYKVFHAINNLLFFIIGSVAFFSPDHSSVGMNLKNRNGNFKNVNFALLYEL